MLTSLVPEVLMMCDVTTNNASHWLSVVTRQCVDSTAEISATVVRIPRIAKLTIENLYSPD